MDLNLLFLEIEETAFEKHSVSVDKSKIEELRNENIMELVDCEEVVLKLQQKVQEETETLLESIKDTVSKIIVPLSKDCFKCEFGFTNEKFPTSGFDKCWEGMPKAEQHIKDMFRPGSLGGWRNPTANMWMINK